MIIIYSKTCINGQDVAIVLTESCGNDEKSHRWCGRCSGTGEMLTKAGEAIIQLVRDHGDFTREGHTHSSEDIF